MNSLITIDVITYQQGIQHYLRLVGGLGETLHLLFPPHTNKSYVAVLRLVPV